MIYPSAKDILMSVCYPMVFGLFFGFASVLYEIFVFSAMKLMALPIDVVKANTAPGLKLIFSKDKGSEQNESKAARLFIDFSFTVFLGISACLLLYLTTDGVFRFYVIAIALGVAKLSRCAMQKVSPKVKTAVDFLINCAVFFFSLILFIPRRILARLLKPLKSLFKKCIRKSKATFIKAVNTKKVKKDSKRLCKKTKK